MPIILTTFEEFAAEHGDHVCIGEHGQRFLFEDGSTSDGRYNHREPPTDRLALLGLRRQYLRARLEREEHKQRQCVAYITVQTDYYRMGAGGAPAEEAFEDLKAFKKSIADLRERLAETEGEIRAMQPPPDRRYVERRAEERAHADRIMARLAHETSDLNL